MKLCYPHDVPQLGIEHTYRHSRVAPIAIAGVSAAFGILWAIYAGRHDGSVVVYLPSLAAALVVLFTLAGARAALSSSNWIVKSATSGVYVQFRSYLNAGFPADAPTIVHLDSSDIRAVRLVREHMTLPNRDGGDLHATLHHLELDLAGVDTSLLQDAIDAERCRRSGGRIVRAKHHDYPVRLIEGNRLRIRMTPKAAAEAAHTLGERYGRGEDEYVERIPWSRMTDEEQEALIVELCERGETVTATRLAQIRYGMDFTRASHFVENVVYSDDR